MIPLPRTERVDVTPLVAARARFVIAVSLMMSVNLEFLRFAAESAAHVRLVQIGAAIAIAGSLAAFGGRRFAGRAMTLGGVTAALGLFLAARSSVPLASLLLALVVFTAAPIAGGLVVSARSARVRRLSQTLGAEPPRAHDALFLARIVRKPAAWWPLLFGAGAAANILAFYVRASGSHRGASSTTTRTAAMGVLVSLVLGYRAAKRRAGRALVGARPRRYTLLLRAFDDDVVEVNDPEDRIYFFRTRRVRLEESLVGALDALGATVALASPRSPELPPGALREAATDAAWRARVEEYIRGAEAIALVLACTPAVAWEIEAIERLGARERTIFVLPPVGSCNDREARWRALAGGSAPHAAYYWDAVAAWIGRDRSLVAIASAHHADAYAAAVSVLLAAARAAGGVRRA